MTRRTLRARCATLLLAFSTGAIAAPDAPARDPLEGKWLGTIGTPRERVAAGLEFRRDAEGKLVLLLTQPVANYFGVEAGTVERDGDRVRLAALHLDLRLRGDRLEGTFPGPNSPASLRRTDALPQPDPMPTLPELPAPRWQTRLGGQVYASPVVADGVAYVGTTGGVLNAVNASDGRIAWTFSAGGPIFGAAAVADDAVYFACDDGWLYKLERVSGKLTWRYPLGDGDVARVLPHPQVYDWDWQGAQPLVADGVVYVGAGTGDLHAVDAASGARRWRFASGARIRNGAALDGERIVFGSADHFVRALDRVSGRELWRYDTGAEIDATPVVHDGRVLVGNRGGGLYSLDARSGELVWMLYFWGSWVESTPVVHDGVIYIGSSDLRRVSKVNPADGRVLWRTDVHGWTWGTPLVVDDALYVAAAGGTPYFIPHVAGLARLDRETGRMLARRALPDTGGHQWGIAGSPVHAGDSVIVASIEGSLYAYPLTDGRRGL